MARPVFVMDITDFRPMVSERPQQFLRWITRKFRPGSEEFPDTAAARMQAGSADSLEMLGAWYAVGATGHDQFRAFSLYQCHGGWSGGWRRMIGLYQNVPESLFLSAIDGVRFGATSVPLVGAPGCPTADDGSAEPIHGSFALVEFADVRLDAGLDYLAATRELRRPILADHGYRLAGLYEVAFSRRRICTLWCGDLDGHVSLLRARDGTRGLDDARLADERVRNWDTVSAEYLEGDSREYLLAAYAGPPLSPPQG
jgi:hypothetical protein